MRRLAFVTLVAVFLVAVFLVAIPALAQDPAVVGSNVYKCVFENERVRLCEVTFKPGASVAVHSHPEHLVYVTSPGKLRITPANGAAVDVDFKAGQALRSGAETHSAVNTGKTELRGLVFELKEPRPMTTEQALMQVERDWSDAMVKGDVATVERFTADDWSMINPMGQRESRADAMASLRSGDLDFESSNLSDLDVKLYGDTAIVTGRSTDKGKYKGMDISGEYRFTDVFVNRNGRWQAVSTTVTRVAQ